MVRNKHSDQGRSDLRNNFIRSTPNHYTI